MKGDIARTTLWVLLIAALFMSTASTARAQSCGYSVALVAGTYANSMSGTGWWPTVCSCGATDRSHGRKYQGLAVVKLEWRLR